MNATYFPGANTGLGFVNRFDGIVPPWAKPHYTYVLKGGPGVGKSTLMRKVAARAAAKGYTVEEFRCASDPDSFDAVRVAELRVVLLDGTAPHSIDPVIPGACDEVIDLGHFLRHEEFMREADRLRARFAANKAHYARAYACRPRTHGTGDRCGGGGAGYARRAQGACAALCRRDGWRQPPSVCRLRHAARRY